MNPVFKLNVSIKLRPRMNPVNGFFNLFCLLIQVFGKIFVLLCFHQDRGIREGITHVRQCLQTQVSVHILHTVTELSLDKSNA